MLFFDIVEGGTGDAGAEAVGLAAFRLKANLVLGAAAARNPSRSASIALIFYSFTVSKKFIITWSMVTWSRLRWS